MKVKRGLQLLLMGFALTISGNAQEQPIEKPVTATKTKEDFRNKYRFEGYEPTTFSTEKQDYGNWKNLVITHPESEPYLDYIEQSCNKYQDIYPVDPILILNLLEQESHFDPNAVSYMGAAGIAQFMPSTAKYEYGLKIYEPKYYNEWLKAFRMKRKYKNLAQSSLMFDGPNEEDMKIDDWVNYVQTYKHGQYVELYNKYSDQERELRDLYKNDLLEHKDEDERFNPEIEIDVCVYYIAKSMKTRDGDIREALSSYNAGMHNVKIYDGIPPYKETVLYQNRIYNGYKSDKKFLERK
ncbi:MAG: transglycosylase SLT domain-containing protein [archaeon]